MAAVTTKTERNLNRLAIASVLVITLVFLAPIYWIASTAVKPRNLATTVPPTVVFTPEISPFVKLFTRRSQLRTQPTPEEYAAAPWWERMVYDGGEKVVRSGRGEVQLSGYPSRFMNSLIVAVVSTVLAVGMGTFTAYGFSRFKVKGEGDLLFFILSTRMMPPIAVAIPIYLMYRELGLSDTALGMILLYTAVNLSLSVWLLKGFIDEIPIEYEEAALIDGYTRFQAFYKVVLPQAATGIASTAIFCLIFAWNEYAFAVLLTSGNAQTAPPFIPTIIGVSGQDWPAVAAGATLFLVPVMVFTILLRKHLLRGITFGAVRK